jgi:hypothetical protein
MGAERSIACLATFFLVMLPAASAMTVEVSNGNSTSIGSSELLTDFGMVSGKIVFKLGNLSWVPSEIWLVPQNTEPDIFSKGLSQQTVIEIPSNVTSSTCRTAVYYNASSGHGFKIYNTGTTTQIFPNGTFCGLAYNGTYFVFAKY